MKNKLNIHSEIYKEKVISLYLDKYNLDKLNYIDSYNKIIIGCKETGKEIEVDPNEFLNNPETDWFSEKKVQEKQNLTEIIVEQGVHYCYFELEVQHIETGFGFISIGVKRKSDEYKINLDFFKYKELHIEVSTSIEHLMMLLNQSNEMNKDNKLELTDELMFYDGYFCFMLDEVQQLKQNQIKILRDSLLKTQGGKCLLCKKEIKLPTLDHYHTKRQHGTGLCRGVICNTCNRMVGVIENNFARNCIKYSDGPEFLNSLAKYLKAQRLPFLHPSEKQEKPLLLKSSYNKLVKLINSDKTLKKQTKIPEYINKRGNFTKKLSELFKKYNLEPELR